MKRIVIDSNVLALLVVGLTRRTFINTHKALKDYPPQSFDWLVAILGSYGEWTVTPGILAETSHHLQSDKPSRNETMRTLKTLFGSVRDQAAQSIDEDHVPISRIVQQDELPLLGVVDSGILTLVRDGASLVTSDFVLWNRAYSINQDCVNFKKVMSDVSLSMK
jgi:hypothetical protein